jgi:Secretory lipase
VAALDAVRAARLFEPAEAGARFAVFGASQGGQAALFTGQRAASYAPELTLVGVAAAAPAADLANLFDENRRHLRPRPLRVRDPRLEPGVPTTPRRGHRRSCRAARPEADRRHLHRRRPECDDRGGAREPAPPDHLPDGGPVGDRALAGLARAEQPRAVPTGAPILVAQGEAERLVRPSITKTFVDWLCRQGETVVYRRAPVPATSRSRRSRLRRSSTGSPIDSPASLLRRAVCPSLA